MGEKKSFILYLDTIKQWDMLSDEQAGKLIKALLRYCESGDKLETDDGMLSMAFGFIIAQIDRDSEKWNTIREKRSEAGKKGGAPKGNNNAKKQPEKQPPKQPEPQKQANQAKQTKQANACPEFSTAENSENMSENAVFNNAVSDYEKQANQAKQAKQAVNVNVNGNVNVNDNVNVNENVINKPHSPAALSRSPLESLIYDYGEENVEKYVQRVESWYAEKGKPLNDVEAVARKWMEQDNVAVIDHSMDKYKCLINRF